MGVRGSTPSSCNCAYRSASWRVRLMLCCSMASVCPRNLFPWVTRSVVIHSAWSPLHGRHPPIVLSHLVLH